MQLQQLAAGTYLPLTNTFNLFQNVNSTKLREILDSLEQRGMLVVAYLYLGLTRFLVKVSRAQISCKCAYMEHLCTRSLSFTATEYVDWALNPRTINHSLNKYTEITQIIILI